MLDLLGVFYDVTKDVKAYFAWKDGTDQLVDINWPQTSGLQAEAAKAGFALRWVRPDEVETRKLEGYEVVLKHDMNERIRRRLVVRGGLVLMRHKVEQPAA
jgi:hypothetical protein